MRLLSVTSTSETIRQMGLAFRSLTTLAETWTTKSEPSLRQATSSPFQTPLLQGQTAGRQSPHRRDLTNPVKGLPRIWLSSSYPHILRADGLAKVSLLSRDDEHDAAGGAVHRAVLEQQRLLHAFRGRPGLIGVLGQAQGRLSLLPQGLIGPVQFLRPPQEIRFVGLALEPLQARFRQELAQVVRYLSTTGSFSLGTTGTRATASR